MVCRSYSILKLHSSHNPSKGTFPFRFCFCASLSHSTTMTSAFESFVAVHQYQLKSIPEDLWQVRISSLIPLKTYIVALAIVYETRRRLSRCRLDHGTSSRPSFTRLFSPLEARCGLLGEAQVTHMKLFKRQPLISFA